MRFLLICSLVLLSGCGSISNFFSGISDWGNKNMPTYDGSRPGASPSASNGPPPIPPMPQNMQQQMNTREFDNGGANYYPDAPQSQYTPPIDNQPQGYAPQYGQQPQAPAYPPQYPAQPQMQQPYYGQQQQPQPQYQQYQQQQYQQPAVPQQYQQAPQTYAPGYAPPPPPLPQRGPVDDFPPEYSNPRKNFYNPGDMAPTPFPQAPTPQGR